MVPETGAEWAPKLAQNGPNTGPAMDPKWARNGPKIGPKTEPEMDQKRSPGSTQNGAAGPGAPPGGGPGEGVGESGGMSYPHFSQGFARSSGATWGCQETAPD